MIENDRCQAFLVSVEGQVTRSDGRPYHITVSTADGVPPATSGTLDPATAIMFSTPFPIIVTPGLKPRWQMIPERLSA